ncbi:MAG: hypothetical protein ACI3W9_07510 [Eubacteriales bacterium]
MKNLKRFFCLLMPALLCFSMLAGCGSSGDKLSDPDAIEAYGIMIWDNELIDVCFTHDREKIYIYYDDGKYALFETVDLPVDDFRAGDNDWRISSIETDDLTGNGYSDLWVYISHSDTSESSILWTWSDDASRFVYHQASSYFYIRNEVNDPPSDFSDYEGTWISSEDNMYENISIEFDREGNWRLYSGDDMIDDGYLHISEDKGTCIYSYQDGALNGGCVELEGERLLIDTAGYFTCVDDTEG